MQCLCFHRLKALAKTVPLGIALVGCIGLQSTAVWAAEFSISPIRLQFAPGMRSGLVTLRSTDKRPIRFQVELVEWTQNALGEDVYTPSDALVFFPRQLTVAPGDKAIIRVGPKAKRTDTEKSYRLRVQELPEVIPESVGAVLNLTITFALPIFIGDTDSQPATRIGALHMQDGNLTATVHNTGKSQFRIETLEVTGADGYSQKIGGWYLLAGAGRAYTLNIPPETCRTQQHLKLNVKVGDQDFTSGLDISPAMCGT